MRYHSVLLVCIGRKIRLAQSVGLVLALFAGVATTALASPASLGQVQPTVSAAWQQSQQARAAHQAQRTADAARASAQPMAITHTVGNCNDSGSGSLRYHVGHANSGDTIDMSTMSCNEIDLDSTIMIYQDDLTLAGKHGSSLFGMAAFPDTRISAEHRAFFHGGAGTLTITYIDLSTSGPTNASGACIWSEANVMIDRSYVHDCLSIRSEASSANGEGGAIYAKGNVTLSGSTGIPFASSRVYDNVAVTGTGNANGGGIYARGRVQIGPRSSVYGNLAESFEGNAYGGGIYSESWVDLTDASSSVHDNEARIHAESPIDIKGAGIYSASDSQIYGSVSGNWAHYVVSGISRVGQGGGIFARDGVEAFQGAEFRDNRGRVSGGAIFTNGYLALSESTVADNSADHAGAIYARGDASIKKSTISGNQSFFSANIRLGEAATTDIVIESSTISNNTVMGASNDGAALYLQHDAVIANSTITNNVERLYSSATKHGAGISLDSNVNVDLESTIISGNSVKPSSGAASASDIGLRKDQTGATLSGSHNLIGRLYGTGLAHPSQTLVTYDPKLGPLQFNGGPTQTHLPKKTSKAIDNGIHVLDPTDQRGEPRRRDGNVDIGAVQLTDMEFNDRIFADGFQ